MKVIGFIMSFVLLIPVNWLNDFEQARQQATEKHQLILMSFSGSDWCGPCIKMKKEIFDTKEFQDFAEDNLVLVRADFPRHKKNQLEARQKEHNEKLAERFNPTGKFPLTLLIDTNGKVLHQWDGYSNMSAATFVDEIRMMAHGK